MSVIDLSCDACGQRLRVPAAHAGKRAKCPKCGAVLVIPADAAGSTTAASVPVVAQPAQSSATQLATAWYLRIPEGHTFGPVSRAELDHWKAEGRIDAECEVGEGEPPEWSGASHIYPDLARASSEAGPVGADFAAPSIDSTASATLAPHRGVLVLVLGILGLTVCGLFAGLPAWLLGTRDLKEMQSGRMDQSGEQLTKIGQILGIVSLVLSMISLLFLVLSVALSFQG